MGLPYEYYHWETADYVSKITDNLIVYILYKNNTDEAFDSYLTFSRLLVSKPCTGAGYTSKYFLHSSL